MTNKLTKRDVIAMMLADSAISGNPIFKEFLETYDSQLANRKASSKPTKVQAQNEEIKELILEVLAGSGSVTVSELQKLDAGLSDLSNQKLSALLRQLVEAGKVVKTIDKKKSYFYLA